jgi:four helix bundle protein
MPSAPSRPRLPDSVRQLDVYRVTLELISTCRPLRGRLQRFNRRLGSQMTEALSSTLQNLAEGMRRTGKDRAFLLTVALGSCDEVRAILEAGVAFGVLPKGEQQQADELADRVCAMTYRLRQRCA